MAGYTPSRVFASIPIPFKENSRPVQMDENLDMFLPGRGSTNRQITVTAVGEVSLPPDRCRVTVKVSSQKDNVSDLKNSIQRRLEYILQTMHNQGIKDTDMKVHKQMRRIDSFYEMTAEVVVVFLDFHKCQTACNLLVEKLDETVIVCPPEFYHASSTLENLRQQASLLAIHNAKQKAQEMARFVNLAVGRPVSIQEEESKEWEGPSDSTADVDANPSIQQRISQNTVTVACRVSASFELKPKVKTKLAKS
ncbi:hypothetical protein CHS0354_023509 [Potamilus streckersoni]|uniref:Interleukin-1 receptor-associated kinase 1-binding protein 1 n=1 Tax=Potamilus streckersoni TaxID=2493646 RepID=A0AAE0RVB9_9BIVA|nr:hypothetical protein CHS0354_023509 [Potamilus streckersoni]